MNILFLNHYSKNYINPGESTFYMGDNKQEKYLVLVGDIGGTNTRIAVVDILTKKFKFLLMKIQPTMPHAHFLSNKEVFF